MEEFISPQEQLLVIEKLYRSTDSISSTKKFNTKYQSKIGRMGIRSMPITDFARKMKQVHFTSYDVERFTKAVTGKTIDLETL